MATAKLTLIGFDKYMTDHDDDLFSGLRDNLPADINADTLINNIIMRGGEFEVMYANPYIMQQLIDTWTRKNGMTFAKWVNALSIEYNPLHNYDRFEKWIDSDTGTTSGSSNADRTITDQESRIGSRENVEELRRNSAQNEHNDIEKENRSDITTVNSEAVYGNSGSDTTNTVSAYNSAVYEPDNKSVTGTNTGTNTAGSGTTTGSGSDSEHGSTTTTGLEYADNDRKEDISDQTAGLTAEKESGSTTGSHDNLGQHEGHLYGNIGVTTSQQMLQSELDIAYWNLYDHIADLFISEFTIPIYF